MPKSLYLTIPAALPLAFAWEYILLASDFSRIELVNVIPLTSLGDRRQSVCKRNNFTISDCFSILERAGSYSCPGCLETGLSTCLPTNSWLLPHWMDTEPNYLISVRSGLSFGSLLWSGANLHKTGSLSEISVLLSNFVDIGQWPNNYQGQRDGQTDNTMAWDFLHWESVFKLHQSWKIMRCFDFMNIFLPLYSPFLLNLLEHKAVICPLLT